MKIDFNRDSDIHSEIINHLFTQESGIEIIQWLNIVIEIGIITMVFRFLKQIKITNVSNKWIFYTANYSHLITEK